MSKDLPLSVTLLVTRPDGCMLGVSRRDDPTKFGMPGGKVDPGETPEQAIVREVHEETGLKLDAPREIYRATCYGTTTYLNIVYQGDVSGDLHTDEPLTIAWVTRETLNEGPFRRYYVGLFRFLDGLCSNPCCPLPGGHEQSCPPCGCDPS